MKMIKSAWLELIFAILISMVVVLSVKNSVKPLPIEHGKHLEQSDIGFGNQNMAAYIQEIQSFGDCTAIFVVKDIQGYFLSADDVEALKGLGFDQAGTLMNQEYHSFIGIWSAGEVAYQCVGGDEAITYGQFLNDHYVYTKSATYQFGNSGEIWIDDVQYAVNNRGFNIVTIRNSDFRLIDSVAYDVYVENVPIYRLADGAVMFVESTRGN